MYLSQAGNLFLYVTGPLFNRRRYRLKIGFLLQQLDCSILLLGTPEIDREIQCKEKQDGEKGKLNVVF